MGLNNGKNMFTFLESIVVQCPVYMGLNNKNRMLFTSSSCCAMPRLYGAEQLKRLEFVNEDVVVQCPVYMGLNNGFPMFCYQ